MADAEQQPEPCTCGKPATVVLELRNIPGQVDPAPPLLLYLCSRCTLHVGAVVAGVLQIRNPR